MKTSPAYRSALVATGILAIGWTLGFLMAGSPERVERDGLARTVALEQHPTTRDRAWRVERFPSSSAIGGDAESESLINPAKGDAIAQFETLMRGALRLTDNTDRMVRLRDIARSISVVDLPAAVDKAKRLPMSERWMAMQALGARWAESAPGAAAEFALAQWLEGFSAGDERDRVVSQFAGAVVQRDPASALSWANTIGDPDLRGAQVEQLAGRWLQTDAAAAREWITSTDQLTPSARRRILEQRTPAYIPSMAYGYYD